MNPTVKIATNVVDGPPASRNGDAPEPRHPSIARPSREIERRPGAEFYDTLLWRLSAQWNESSVGYSLGLTSCSRSRGRESLSGELSDSGGRSRHWAGAARRRQRSQRPPPSTINGSQHPQFGRGSCGTDTLCSVNLPNLGRRSRRVATGRGRVAEPMVWRLCPDRSAPVRLPRKLCVGAGRFAARARASASRYLWRGFSTPQYS